MTTLQIIVLIVYILMVFYTDYRIYLTNKLWSELPENKEYVEEYRYLNDDYITKLFMQFVKLFFPIILITSIFLYGVTILNPKRSIFDGKMIEPKKD